MFCSSVSFGLSGYVWPFPDLPGCTDDPLHVPVICGCFRIFPFFPLRPSHLTIDPFHGHDICGFFRFSPAISQLFPLRFLSFPDISASAQPSHNCSPSCLCDGWALPDFSDSVRFGPLFSPEISMDSSASAELSHNSSISCVPVVSGCFRSFRVFPLRPPSHK